MIELNQKAPLFTLKNQDEQDISLVDYKGKKVLLAFFPFAFSSVCTTEMGCFEDDMKKFNEKNISVLAISVDSHFALKAFQEKLNVKIPFLSDFSKTVCKLYGTLREEGFSERAYFLVNETGDITYKHIMGTPGERLENKDLLNQF